MRTSHFLCVSFIIAGKTKTFSHSVFQRRPGQTRGTLSIIMNKSDKHLKRTNHVTLLPFRCSCNIRLDPPHFHSVLLLPVVLALVQRLILQQSQSKPAALPASQVMRFEIIWGDPSVPYRPTMPQTAGVIPVCELGVCYGTLPSPYLSKHRAETKPLVL